ncbi:MAG TPA: UDP-glucose 4-epimerase GalE, partial [Bacteroidota bacterium]|nr:UDP-glucose 4-epimerase GalE [Bacteroidota bacterium]
MNETVLVTGGLGYIGSHTVIELLANGIKPVIVDNLSNSKIVVKDLIESVAGEKIEFVQLDFTNRQALEQFASSYPKIESIIHFAAHKYVGESVQEPLKYYQNNLGSLLNLLQVFGNRPLNFIFSSSCTVYGEPDVLPVTETSEIKKAESPYGNTKQIAEEILRDAAKINPLLRVAVLRYFNPVGSHSSGKIGELPLHVPQNLFPFITQTAIGIRKQLTVFGGDYHTPDGTCIRDYIHVVDLAQSHISAMKYLAKHRTDEMNYDVFNIGTGTGYSVLEIIKAFESVNNVKVNYTIGPRRAGDIEKIFGSPDKANTLLHWKAKYTL